MLPISVATSRATSTAHTRPPWLPSGSDAHRNGDHAQQAPGVAQAQDLAAPEDIEHAHVQRRTGHSDRVRVIHKRQRERHVLRCAPCQLLQDDATARDLVPLLRILGHHGRFRARHALRRSAGEQQPSALASRTHRHIGAPTLQRRREAAPRGVTQHKHDIRRPLSASPRPRVRIALLRRPPVQVLGQRHNRAASQQRDQQQSKTLPRQPLQAKPGWPPGQATPTERPPLDPADRSLEGRLRGHR